MAANNTIMLIGRVGKEPESKTTPTGKAVTRFGLAVNRPGQQKATDWFGVELWGKQAELALSLLKKGSHVSVAGTCHIDEYQDKQGQTQRMVKGTADGFQILERRQEQDEIPHF